MNFPVWDLGMAPGLLIAIVATLHVFVSHFAIGTGLFLVLTERKAYREDDKDLLAFLKRHSLIFILFSVVFGAITGVGIWFVIGLINPAATSSLIHAFVFGWAIEWVFFLVEIIAGLIYYYSWERMERSTHLTIGWIYFVSAWFSLVVINGIVTYMLTPGAWLETQNFWDGFFNPTYFPSLVSRTFLSFALAGIYALLTASFQENREFRLKITRYAGKWVIINLILFGLSLLWYWKIFPDRIIEAAQGAIPITQSMVGWVYIFFLALILVTLIVSIILPRLNRAPVAIFVMLLSLGLFGATEWVRESLRKPYGIYNYIYSNGIFPEQIDEINKNGVLLWANWVSDEAKAVRSPDTTGYEIFRTECMNCHSLSGYMNVGRYIEGWDQQYLYEILGRLEVLRGRMPPFAGTEEERYHVVSYLSRFSGEPRIYDSGKEVYDDRCGNCHTIGRYRDIIPVTSDFSQEELQEEIIPMLSEMNEDMPPFTAGEEAAEKLARYLSELSNKEGRNE